MASVRETIAGAILQIVHEKGTPIDAISDSDTLQGSLGLDSLDLAVLVVRLEQQLGYDPFREGGRLAHTFGELVARYDQSERGRA